MRILTIFTALAAGTVVLAAMPCQAETVTVRNTHLCCGGCVAGAEEALADVPGVSDVNCDLNAKTVAFAAQDLAAARRGLAALAKGGFYGTASYGKQKLEFPSPQVKKGEKSNSFTLGGLHLCCGACVTASQTALTELKGAAVIDVDRNEQTIKISGDGILIQDAIDLLNKAGFYGQPVSPKKPAAAAN